MSKEEIEEVLARVLTWPPGRQEEAVLMLLAMEDAGTGAYVLSDDERRDIEEALAEVERGEIATEEEVDAVLKRHR